MHYIVFDLEFNQDISSIQNTEMKLFQCPFEIIQIGAVKLDLEFNIIDSFNCFVKPTIFGKVNPFITNLTGITTEKLLSENTFPNIYNEYIKFIDGTDSILITWGMSDLTVLFKNVDYHNLNSNILTKYYINLQSYVTKHFELPSKSLLQLKHAVELLNIPIKYEFHDALNDAYYTAEIYKKIHTSYMQPLLYDPSFVKIRQRQIKKVPDFHKLVQQFEKMYDRNMSEEEQDMIKLAYKMGKTGQFLK